MGRQAERKADMELQLRRGALTAAAETLGGELVSLREWTGVHLGRRSRLLDGEEPGALSHRGRPEGG